jgi:hypothetical protein
MAGAESATTWVDDADTTNGSWSFGLKTSGGTAAAAMSLIVQYKKVTGTATQTFNPTQTSADTMIQWTELTAPTPTPTPSGNKSKHFFDWYP